MGCSCSIEQIQDINSLEKEILNFIKTNQDYREVDGTYSASIVDEAILLANKLYSLVGYKHKLFDKLNHFISNDYRNQQ